MAYSMGFRARMIQRMLDPATLSVREVSRESGVPPTTLSRWLREARNGRLGGMSTPATNPSGQGAEGKRRPQDWSAAEKLEAVLEASSLSEEDLGSFLRSKGLHEADLTAWRKTVMTAATTALGPRPKKDRQRRSKESRRIRELEKELVRKEKALAEAAALLILKKKVQAIWGGEDASTNGERGS